MIVYNVLTGEYVSKTIFYTKVVPYIYILFLGGIFVEFIGRISTEMIYNVVGYPLLFYYGKMEYIIANALYHLVVETVSISIIWLTLRILYYLPVSFWLISFVDFFLLMIFSFSILFFMLSLTMRFRKDAFPVCGMFNTLAYSIFPATFALTIFPEKIRYFLEIYLPPMGIIEETRKLVILGYFNLNVLVLSIVISFFYLLVSLYVFNYAFHLARRKGYISLK